MTLSIILLSITALQDSDEEQEEGCWSEVSDEEEEDIGMTPSSPPVTQPPGGALREEDSRECTRLLGPQANHDDTWACKEHIRIIEQYHRKEISFVVADMKIKDLLTRESARNAEAEEKRKSDLQAFAARFKAPRSKVDKKRKKPPATKGRGPSKKKNGSRKGDVKPETINKRLADFPGHFVVRYGQLHCPTCCVNVGSAKTSAEQHIRSKKHKKKKAAHEAALDCRRELADKLHEVQERFRTEHDGARNARHCQRLHGHAGVPLRSVAANSRDGAPSSHD